MCQVLTLHWAMFAKSNETKNNKSLKACFSVRGTSTATLTPPHQLRHPPPPPSSHPCLENTKGQPRVTHQQHNSTFEKKKNYENPSSLTQYLHSILNPSGFTSSSRRQAGSCHFLHNPLGCVEMSGHPAFPF